MDWKKAARELRQRRNRWRAHARMWEQIAKRKTEALDEFSIRLMKLITEIEKKAIGG